MFFGIRDGKKPGSGIRDKHPGSATLLTLLNLNNFHVRMVIHLSHQKLHNFLM